MGDICNMSDLERFMRSPEGKEHLEEIQQMLVGKKVTEVTFSNEVQFIATTLHLDDGTTFVVFQPSLEVDAIQEQFQDVIEREYYVDYPDRKPGQKDRR